MHPPKAETDLAEDDKRIWFEDIEVDEVRQQAVLEAFKVRHSLRTRQEIELMAEFPVAFVLGLRAGCVRL